jgi:GT2 family glycosyltransferase
VIKIMLAVPTLNRRDRLEEMLRSVAASTRQPDRVLLINNGHQLDDAFREEWSRSFELDVFTPQHNLGVAGSVNFAWRNTPDGWYWCHCNDDAELDPKCLGLMAEAAKENPDAFIVPEHGEGSAFTLFIASSAMRDKVGYFDEAFFPAYYEDVDLGRRMILSGIKRVIVKGAAYVHHTSSTLKAYTPEQERKHHDQFRSNCQKYVEKWGGEADKSEKFTVPYNGARGHTLQNIHLWHRDRI